MSPTLIERKEEVLEYLKEALEVYGWNYKTENVHSVSVQFDFRP